MRVNIKNYAGLIDSKTKSRIIDHSQEDSEFHINVRHHVKTWDTDYYLFAKTVLEDVERLKIDRNINTEIFKRIKRNSCTYLIDEKEAYHYYFRDTNTLSVLQLTFLDNRYDWHSFSVKIGSDQFLYDDAMEDRLTRFLKLLVYCEFTEKKEVLMRPNAKIGTKREGTIKNDSLHNVTIIDRSWNKIYHKAAHQVRGHYRLQPCGVGLTDVKLIFIEGYLKGAIRKVNS